MLAEAHLEAEALQAVSLSLEILRRKFNPDVMRGSLCALTGKCGSALGQRHEHDLLRDANLRLPRLEEDCTPKVGWGHHRQPQKIAIKAQRLLHVMDPDHYLRKTPDLWHDVASIRTVPRV